MRETDGTEGGFGGGRAESEDSTGGCGGTADGDCSEDFAKSCGTETGAETDTAGGKEMVRLDQSTNGL